MMISCAMTVTLPIGVCGAGPGTAAVLGDGLRCSTGLAAPGSKTSWTRLSPYRGSAAHVPGASAHGGVGNKTGRRAVSSSMMAAQRPPPDGGQEFVRLVQQPALPSRAPQ